MSDPDSNLPENSIKERIERAVVAQLAADLDIDPENVQRYDDENNGGVNDDAGNPPEGWLQVTFGDEDVPEEGEADNTETQLLPVTVDVHLSRGAQPAGVTIAEWANRWIAGVRKSLRANAQVIEGGTDKELAIDTRITGTFSAQPVNGRREILCGVEAEISYRFKDADPESAVG